MTPDEFRQYQAFARLDGLYLGLVWVGCFACYIYGFSSPLTGLTGTIATILSPLYAVVRLKKFRDEVRAGVLSFLRAMFYYLQMFFYASLILALAQWIYFEFIDGGYLIDVYAATLSSPEADAIIKAYGITKEQIEQALIAFRETNAITIVANIFSMNVIIGFILSIPVALIMKRNQ